VSSEKKLLYITDGCSGAERARIGGRPRGPAESILASYM
jgi:hypothetical protein